MIGRCLVHYSMRLYVNLDIRQGRGQGRSLSLSVNSLADECGQRDRSLGLDTITSPLKYLVDLVRKQVFIESKLRIYLGR